MSKEKMLRVRLSEEEFERLEKYAQSKGWSMSFVVREYVKKLPKLKE